MKKKVLVILGIVLLGGVLIGSILMTNNGGSSSSLKVGKNGYLEETRTELGKWSLYNISSASVKGSGKETVSLDIKDMGTSEDDIQLILNEAIELTAGRSEVSLTIDNTSERSARLVLESTDAKKIYDQVITLKEGENNIQLPVEVEADKVAVKFSLRLGKFTGEELKSHTIEVANVAFKQTKAVEVQAEGESESNLFVNMVTNFDISQGLEPWGNYNMKDGVATLEVEDEALKVHVTNNGTTEYAVQVYQDGMKLYKGNKYKISFKYKGTEQRIFEARVQMNGGDYRAYVGDGNITFNSEWQTYEKEFVMEEASDELARLQFNIGLKGAATPVDETIYFDDVELVMTEGNVPLPEKENPIRVNQVGYRNGDAKVAFVVADERTYKIYTVDDKLVYTGNFILKTKDVSGKPYEDKNSGDVVRKADFTEFDLNGKYYIKVREDKSPVFAINENVYDDVTKALVKFFYYQRSGGEGIDATYVGNTFAHGPSHMGHAKYYDESDPTYGSVEVDVSGGWYDAGDYGRYVTPAAKAVVDLFMTSEHFPKMNEIDYDMPGTLLEEARYEVEWMLKMQNPETGGVYHKVTTMYHTGMNVLPQNDIDQLYLSPVSPQAAGDFVATMAYANRMYKDDDETFANECLAAAEKAWAWLEENKSANVYEDPDFFHTGPYGDGNSSDERYWAATELYKTTGDEKYHDYIVKNDLPSAGFGWSDMGSYALISYLTNDSVDEDSELYKEMKERFIDDADNLINTWANDGYNVVLDDYVWGSNKDLLDKTMILILANRLEENVEYQEAIMDQVDYLLGRNAMNTSYITDFGDNSARNPHHRMCSTLGEVIPGMVVGGPNGRIVEVTGDPVANMVDSYTPPAKCYADVVGSYATNEITIYWNSPAAYIFGYLNEEDGK